MDCTRRSFEIHPIQPPLPIFTTIRPPLRLNTASITKRWQPPLSQAAIPQQRRYVSDRDQRYPRSSCKRTTRPKRHPPMCPIPSQRAIDSTHSQHQPYFLTSKQLPLLYIHRPGPHQLPGLHREAQPVMGHFRNQLNSYVSPSLRYNAPRTISP